MIILKGTDTPTAQMPCCISAPILGKDRFQIIYKNELIAVHINIDNPEFEKLKTALKKIANKEGQLKINE